MKPEEDLAYIEAVLSAAVAEVQRLRAAIAEALRLATLPDHLDVEEALLFIQRVLSAAAGEASVNA